jgi:hypothetical protein
LSLGGRGDVASGAAAADADADDAATGPALLLLRERAGATTASGSS